MLNHANSFRTDTRICKNQVDKNNDKSYNNNNNNNNNNNVLKNDKNS